MRVIRRRWKVLLGAVAAVGISVAIFPTVASATFLRTLVRRELRSRAGADADVGHVAIGWTTGAVVDKVLIPGVPSARSGRPVLALEHAATRVSLLRAAAAAITGGEIDASLEVRKASLYLELLPDGTTNVASSGNKAPSAAKAPGKPDEPIRLPLSANAHVKIEALDAEVADFRRPDGVRRTVLKGLRVLTRIHVARDGTTSAAIEEATPTVTFDELRVTGEPEEGPATLLLRVTRPHVAIDGTYFASRKTAGAGPAFLASARRVSASVPAIARLESDLFDALDVTLSTGILDKNPLGHTLARLVVDGAPVEKRPGAIHLALMADLASGASVPLVLDLAVTELSIEKTVRRLAPAFAPTEGARVPTLTLASKGSAAAAFDASGALERESTLDSIDDAGTLDLGPGTLEGSLFLERYRAALEKLGIGATLTQTIGPGCDFDGAHGSYRVEKGVVTIPDLVVRRQGTAMAVIKGTSKLDGRYDLHVTMNAKPGSDAAKVLACLEAAGGVRVTGVVGGDFAIVTPSAKDFGKVLRERGASEALRSLEAKHKVPPGTDKRSEESKKALEGLFERDKK